MKITENFLKYFLDVPSDIALLTNKHITEVDSFSVPFNINDLVIGQVIECANHPNSDHLHITKVDVKTEILDIVCGAPNVAKNQYVIVAKAGAKLPNGLIIKRSVIRGIESNGMICSLQELDFEDKFIPADYINGIYYFKEDMKMHLGVNALSVLNLTGFVLELGLTPNRSDLLSYLGYALDLAAITKEKVALPLASVTESINNNPLKVIIETDGCKVYYARHLTNIKVTESPWWLKGILIQNDIRPINNVVDITNYILLAYGTPLHAFDAKKIQTDKIIVKESVLGDTVTTLDNEERTLKNTDILVTNGVSPLAIGGVMGLLNSGIDENTTEVILEAAYFDPKRIKETAKHLNLKSESSIRFEKGIDITRIKEGLEKAAELLIKLAGAQVSKGIIMAGSAEHETVFIDISKEYIDKHLGTNIKEEVLIDIFQRLNYQIITKDGCYRLGIPAYREDVKIAADVLEEVARVYGYDNLLAKPLSSITGGALTFKQKNIRKLRHLLASNGLMEIISYTLQKENEVQKFADTGKKALLLQPLSEDRKAVRQSLVNGLIEVLNYNQSRKNRDCYLFEIGNCYSLDSEALKLAVLISGSYLSRRLDGFNLGDSFYLLKGLLVKIAYEFNIQIELQETKKIAALHPNKQADIIVGREVIGFIGELHPHEQKYYDVEKTVFFELDLNKLFAAIDNITYHPVSKYPSVTRDIAFVVDDTIDTKALEVMIRQTTKKYLTNLVIFDVYYGESIGDGKKSLAYSLTFNDQTKTLESGDVDKLMKSVQSRLVYEFKALIRQ